VRIIGGSHKGRKVQAPKKLPVRPTTDFAKEGLFNLLQNQMEFEGLDILDLCSGTGNIAFEFCSRGANSVQCVDQHYPCIAFIKKTAAELGFEKLSTRKADLFKHLSQTQTSYHIIFADPPYAMEGLEKLIDLVFERELLKPNGILILEHDKRSDYSEHPSFSSQRKYGNVNFTFFEPRSE
jgi:16S rRNA (guanine(966)-N(2))-methyltransferase RsmD